MGSRLLTAGTLAAALTVAACGTSVDVRSRGAASMDKSGGSTTVLPGTTSPSTSARPTTTTGAATTAPNEPSSTTGATVPTPTLRWSSCGLDLQCATLTAPLDYSDPSAGTVKLHVVKAPATDPSARIGSLLVNPGGPGFGGSYLAENADAIYSQSIRQHFDIVAWDPRGTGESDPAVDCVDTYDQYFGLDPTPDTPAEEQALVDAAKKFADACAQRTGVKVLAHISTEETARDMDLLRRALGEDKISYFGFSYGSELGATWATMFPDTVRAAVLDGAADPNADAMQGSIDQAKGFEIALNAFLDDCKHKCAFAQGGDPGAALDKILADIDKNNYPTAPGRPPLTQGMAYTGIVDALYSQSLWSELADALEQVRQGDASGLLRMYDDYFQRNSDGTYGNELEAFIAITCLDDSGPTTVEGVDAYNPQILAVAPRIGPSFEHGYSCVFWPVKSVPKVQVTGKGAGPIIVIGTTNDPATPFESSMKMARSLEHGIFVKVVGNGHTGYSQSPCAQDVVDKYLVDLQPPTADVDCE